MAATSFQYNYPLNVNPRVADQNQAMIYPYQRWADNATSLSPYIYGRLLPEKSYYGEDLNLSARPITRVIQPHVLEYAPLMGCPFHGGKCDCVTGEDTRTIAVAPFVASPVLNNRFAALGSQVTEKQRSFMYLLAILALVGVAGYFVMRKQ